MTDYGKNFGVRNSAEDAASREGRWRIPSAANGGADFQNGDYVIHDADNPGFVKVAPTNTVPAVGVAGINVQSSGWYQTLGKYEIDSLDRGKCQPGHLTAVWSGAVGIKLWYRNTPARTLFDGRTIPANTRLKGDIEVGNYVTWSATDRTYVGTNVRTNAVGQITQASESGDYAEIVFF